MNPRETLLKAKELYDLVMELITLTDNEEIQKKNEIITDKINEIHQNDELKEFVDSIKSILKVFNLNPLDECNRHKSFFNLLSLMSAQRSKIIEKYGFCSEPE